MTSEYTIPGLRRYGEGLSREERTKTAEVFVLTRFAIRPDSELAIFPRATENPRYLDKSWLETRIERLVKFTIPSLTSQSDPSFKWFVGVDSSVPRDIIARLTNVLPYFAVMVKTSSKSTFNAAMSDRLRGEGHSQITVRLDSDDAISKEFIASVKKACTQDGVVYNFPSGLGYFDRDGIAVRKFIRASPFIATRGNPDSHILTFGLHSGVGGKARVKEIPTVRPMWLKVYSAEMTSNLPINGFATLRAPRKLLRKHFGIESKIVATTLTNRMTFTYSFFGRLGGRKFPFLLKLWLLTRPNATFSGLAKGRRL